MICSLSFSANILLVLFSGVLCDKLGARIVLLGSSVLFAASTALIVLATRVISTQLLVLAWILVQIAGQSIAVSGVLLINQYYHENELGFISGIITSMSYGTTALNLNIQPKICEEYGLLTTVTGTLLVSLISLFLALVVFNKDNQVVEQIKQSSGEPISLASISVKDT